MPSEMPKLFSPTAESTLDEATPDELKPLVVNYAGLSKLIDRSVSTLERMKASRKLPPSVRMGNSCKWLVADIELWVALGCPNEREFVARKKLVKK
jgi:predicted DNA-binding transcriptional regulator AlpA